MLQIGIQDRFAYGPWPGPQTLPETGEDFIEAANAGRALAPLNAMAAGDRTLPLEDKVDRVKSWLASGQFPDLPKYRDQSLAFAETIEKAFHNGGIGWELAANGRVAIIESQVQGALSVIGYRLAPVVIAVNPNHRFHDGLAGRKYTVAQFQAGYADFGRIGDALRRLETGWGGAPTILGSPQGNPSQLETETVLAIVKQALQ